MAKPTEGPYTIDRPHRKTILILARDGNVIADLYVTGADEEWDGQQEGHARLLAKSWEMREALREICKLNDNAPLAAKHMGAIAHAMVSEIDGDSQ